MFVSHTARNERPYFDPSVRYRCFNFAEQARRMGIRSYVVSQNWLEAEDELPKADMYVFHRPKLSSRFAKIFDQIPADAIKIADYDDLVFDISVADQTSAVRSRDTPVWNVRAHLSANYGGLCLFDHVTVSTGPLKDAILRLRPEASVTVLPNVPDYSYIALAKQLRVRSANDRIGRIGYFSGTNSHNEDLASVAEPLAEFCSSKDVEFYLVGPVEIPQPLKSPSVNLRLSKVKSFFDMARDVANCDLVIAPLTSTPFNECKSGIKFMESAVLSVGVVATPIADVDRFSSPLLFKASSVDDWSSKLGEAWNRNRINDLQACVDLEARLESDRDIYSNFLASFE